MKKNPLLLITLQLGVAVFLTLTVMISRYFAPIAASALNDTTFLLNWGAPAVFAPQTQEHIADRIEPWTMLGVTMPVFRGLNPQVKPPTIPVTPPPVQEPIDDESPVVVNPPNQTDLSKFTIGIFHSHTEESFVRSFNVQRSSNESENVVRLGAKLTELLQAQGVNVIHRRDNHERKPNGTGDHGNAYKNSAFTVKEMMSENNLELIIDLHRDAVHRNLQTSRDKTISKVNGRSVSRIAFIVGQNHHNWRDNYDVAYKLHLLLEREYPGVSRGIILKPKSTFNQELSANAILVEIGDYSHSIEEVEYSIEIFAKITALYLQSR